MALKYGKKQRRNGNILYTIITVILLCTVFCADALFYFTTYLIYSALVLTMVLTFFTVLCIINTKKRSKGPHYDRNIKEAF